ncbi:MAG: sensor domain-containing diguanylate cyclase [Nitrospiria bacterium]
MEENDLEILLNQVKDGVLLVDGEGCVTFMNREITRLLNVGDRHLIGNVGCGELLGCLSRKGCPIGKNPENEKFHMTARVHGTCREVKYQKKQFFQVSCSPLFYPNNGLSAKAILIVRDETEDKRIKIRLKQLSESDALTGLYNRRGLLNRLRKEMVRSRRYRHLVSLFMIDVDDFKKYNDSHGHPAGDRLLIQLAKIFLSRTRATDFVGRYGGEEFVVVLPETRESEAGSVAEKLLRTVKNETEKGISVSIGVSCFPKDAKNLGDLIQKADQALYQAKKTGKNKVVYFKESEKSHDFICGDSRGRKRMAAGQN